MPELDPFAAAEFSVLPAELVAAIEAAPMPGLGEGPQDSSLAGVLAGNPLQQADELSEGQRQLCTSGLWLLAGDLDRSHTISQDLPSQEGSFWHGVMHRREGDFGNAKYWFRRVGDHPVFAVIADRSEGDYDDPYDFVDACSRASKSEAVQRCQRAQWIEWQTLMVHCLTNC